MIDFLCLPQKPFATEEDGARSRVSLKAINDWYFHPFTYTLLAAVPGCFTHGGWDLVHQYASFVVKHPHCLLDFDGYVADTRAPPSSAVRLAPARRRAPSR